MSKSNTTREEATENEYIVVQRLVLGGVRRRTLNLKGYDGSFYNLETGC